MSITDYSIPPRSLSLRGIDLVDSNIDPAAVRDITLLPKALEMFTYTWDNSGWGIEDRLDCSLLFEGIKAQAESLTSLNISTSISHRHHQPTIDAPIGALRDFSTLKHVTLFAGVLLSSPLRSSAPSPLAELLPPTLVTLDISLGDPWDLRLSMAVTGCPYTWTETRRSFKSLETFCIHCDERVFIELILAFRNAGITISMSYLLLLRGHLQPIIRSKQKSATKTATVGRTSQLL